METLEIKEVKGAEETRMTQEYIDFLEETYGDGCKRSVAQLFVAGIDSGAAATKVVIMRSDGCIVGKAVTDTGEGPAGAAEEALSEALKEAGLVKEDISKTVSTGCGRMEVESDGIESAGSCQAAGARLLCPGVKTVLDLGGQHRKETERGTCG